MKRNMVSTILLVVSFASSLCFGQASTSVNGAYNDSKKSNTMGMIANVAGGGLHAIEAYTNWGKCASQVYPACAIAVVQTMAAVSSFGQAGSHGSSNQNLIPDMCKTAAGICNPNQFQWPDFNSCAGNVSCYNNLLSTTSNPDLSNVFTPGADNGAGNTIPNAFNEYDKMMDGLKKAGGSFDPKTGSISFNGQTFNPKDFQKLSDASKIPGMTEANLAKIAESNAKIDKTLSSLTADPKIQSAANGDLVNAAIAAANGGANGLGGKGSGPGGSLAGIDGESAAGGVVLDSLGGGGAAGAGGMFGDGDGMGDGKNGANRKLKSGRAGRVPAGVAGKKRMFNGEPIGVSGDSIFEMMNRRYQVKTQQNSFLDPVLVAPK